MHGDCRRREQSRFGILVQLMKRSCGDNNKCIDFIYLNSDYINNSDDASPWPAAVGLQALLGRKICQLLHGWDFLF